MKKELWLAVTALLACACGPADEDSALVTPVAGEPSSELATVHPIVVCSGDTCRRIQHVDRPRAQQGLSTVNYSTYLGFAGHEWGGRAVAVDSSGNAYITGETTSFGGSKPFVAKMSPTGQLIYFTYFSSNGYGVDIKVDTSGNTYVVAGVGGGSGSIVAKLNSSGSAFVYYITVPWMLTGIAVDSLRNAYILGESYADSTKSTEVLVSKLNPDGSAFVYSVTFGGMTIEKTEDIDVDSAGNAYVVGWTQSPDFPVRNAFQGTLTGGSATFISKLNATGTALLYSTFLGCPGGDSFGVGIALDDAGNAYVTGTAGANFPVTPGAAQTSFGGAIDRYVAKLSATGWLAYATYLGGSGNENLYGGIAVNRSTGTAYVTGNTLSLNFPVTYNAFQPFSYGGSDAFLAQISPSGNAIGYSTYLGGSQEDIGRGIALDPSMNVYVTGNTFSSDFPTNVYGSGGGTDAFVTKFSGP
ncbi:SBBP repeat-containing protein [Archangium violaceum]|uniref:SBBP repeat-containing protein n=1 Tax=Archangium violaceum TaxID=83451 RepID=UPI00195150A9|nr:SBBP repeat-containing protein [Archangium violaceum]QRN95926.1 SBBP repeat-containing protein [Archangium violaceum]